MIDDNKLFVPPHSYYKSYVFDPLAYFLVKNEIFLLIIDCHKQKEQLKMLSVFSVHIGESFTLQWEETFEMLKNMS